MSILRTALSTLGLSLGLLSVGYVMLPAPQVIRPGIEAEVNSIVRSSKSHKDAIARILTFKASQEPLNRPETYYFDLTTSIFNQI
jgi:hypothetical protein